MLNIRQQTPLAWGIRKLELEVFMLSKCVNPTCSAVFRYLHEGKVFRLERDLGDDSDSHARHFEYFWLCSSCAGYLKVVYERDGVKVRPSHAQLGTGSTPVSPIQRRRIA